MEQAKVVHYVLRDGKHQGAGRTYCGKPIDMALFHVLHYPVRCAQCPSGDATCPACLSVKEKDVVAQMQIGCGL